MILSFLSSDLICGIVMETILVKESKGSKFGWTLSPFKPYLKKEKAIIIGIIQFASTVLIPFFFLTDLFTSYYCTFDITILYPFSLVVFKTIYLTSIRGRFEYKFTRKELIIAIGVYSLAILWILYIVFYGVFEQNTSSLCPEIITE